MSEVLSSGNPQSFCLHFKLDNSLNFTLESVNLCTILLHLDNILAPNSNGGAYSASAFPPAVGTTH